MRRTLILFIVALVFACCTDGRSGHGDTMQKGEHRPASRGLPYEVVLIIPRAQYAGELRDSLDAMMHSSTPILPQHEPLFRLSVAYMEGNLTPWRTFRSRLVVEVSRKAGKPRMEIARNAVAFPQTEVRLSAGAAQDLAAFIGRHRERIVDVFVEDELLAEASHLRRRHSKQTSDKLQQLSSHTVCVPAALKASKVGQDFLWTGTNLNDRDQNFVFYAYPWNGCELTETSFVEMHDSVMKRNIQGGQAGQWLQVARVPQGGDALVDSRARIINNVSVHEVRGLWEMRNAALGGPFIAHERIDSVHRRVLVTEAFIYSPHSPKRNLLRQMEAALRTFK